MKAWAALFALLALSCASSAEVRDQWLVTLGTDARTPALGDRLLVEVLDEDGELACSACRRLFGAGGAEVWPLSFGIAQGGAARFVRARLYRSALTGPAGFPEGSALIDHVGRLEPGPGGNNHVSLVLQASCFGLAADLERGQTCVDGALEPIRVLSDEPSPEPGSAELFAEGNCPDVPSDMVCVPGGAFILGSPLAIADDPEFLPVPERLVKMSSFALDRDEFSVADLRASISVLGIQERPRSRASDPRLVDAACTFLGQTVPDNDALPANCLPRSAAAKLCAARGKRLPSEAEWEYAASNLGAETAYPWGEDADVCATAIVGRGRSVLEAEVFEADACRVASDDEVLPWGLVAGGSNADQTALGVLNLGGSLAEFVDGAFASYSDGCWGGPVVVDPSCAAATEVTRYATSIPVRGGWWAALLNNTKAASRSAVMRDTGNAYLGFRCAQTL